MYSNHEFLEINIYVHDLIHNIKLLNYYFLKLMINY